LQPDYAPALLAKGRVLLAENKTGAAILNLQQAAKLNPLPEYQWTLADALRAAKREEEARAVETQLQAKGASEDPRTYALYLAARGEQLETAVKLAEAERKERNDMFTLDAQAWALSAAGKHEEAYALMQQALAEKTKDARLFLHAAVIAHKSGRAAEAQLHAKQATTIAQMLLPGERAQLQQLRFPPTGRKL
jgi:tetratricopeptide (TPR) repeat protein